VVASNDSSAPEVYAVEPAGLRKLTHHNDAEMAELALGGVEDISFPSRDGTIIHGMMVKPADYRAGQAYPTILWIHGGPNGQDSHGLSIDAYSPELERQWFAAHGYVVLAVNYRGSSGRGAAFAQAIAADWGHKEVADLLGAVDYAVREKIADPHRLGVGGWSYGGILTDYLIASDTRFKAAISGAGSANQISMYGADQYILQYNAELQPPWASTRCGSRCPIPSFTPIASRRRPCFSAGEGFQRADRGRRANVRSAAHARRAGAAHRLSGAVSCAHSPELYQGLHPALPRLVRPLSGDDRPLRAGPGGREPVASRLRIGSQIPLMTKGRRHLLPHCKARNVI
jgi:poly(3-hydroxybutyrate) depolymerase